MESTIKEGKLKEKKEENDNKRRKQGRSTYKRGKMVYSRLV